MAPSDDKTAFERLLDLFNLEQIDRDLFLGEALFGGQALPLPCLLVHLVRHHYIRKSGTKVLDCNC